MGPVRTCQLILVVAACTPPTANEPATTSASTGASESTAASEPTTQAPTTGSTTTGECASESDDLFNKRIAPLLATDRPKTCNTCHLSGVDLALFVQDTPCQTMACLDTRGLVDLADPASSVILQWISRADPSSPLIDQSVIDEEYAAFLAWIEATAACGLCYAGDTPCGTPTDEGCASDDPKNDPYVDPGDCSPVTREALFRHNVYAWRDRCFPCHFDDTDFEAPKWIATGPCDVASLGTMRNVLERGLVDFADPSQSLLLLKPLGAVEHGGSTKFHDTEDLAYIAIRTWIEREVACTP